MKFVRYSYDCVTRKYELDITEEYAQKLNTALTQYGVMKHPTITKQMIAAVAKHDHNYSEFPDLECLLDNGRYKFTLANYIWDYISEDVWYGNNRIIRNETEDYDDDIEMTPEEVELYREYVQMSIFDEPEDAEKECD